MKRAVEPLSHTPPHKGLSQSRISSPANQDQHVILDCIRPYLTLGKAVGLLPFLTVDNSSSFDKKKAWKDWLFVIISILFHLLMLAAGQWCIFGVYKNIYDIYAQSPAHFRVLSFVYMTAIFTMGTFVIPQMAGWFLALKDIKKVLISLSNVNLSEDNLKRICGKLGCALSCAILGTGMVISSIPLFAVYWFPKIEPMNPGLNIKTVWVVMWSYLIALFGDVVYSALNLAIKTAFKTLVNERLECHIYARQPRRVQVGNRVPLGVYFLFTKTI